MTVEQIAAEIMKLTEGDRQNLKAMVEDDETICPTCWSSNGTWCCQDPKE